MTLIDWSHLTDNEWPLRWDWAKTESVLLSYWLTDWLTVNFFHSLRVGDCREYECLWICEIYSLTLLLRVFLMRRSFRPPFQGYIVKRETIRKTNQKVDFDSSFTHTFFATWQLLLSGKIISTLETNWEFNFGRTGCTFPKTNSEACPRHK